MFIPARDFLLETPWRIIIPNPLMTPMEFSRAEDSGRSQRPLSTKQPEFALSVAVVDTRRVLRHEKPLRGGV
jgi:hypothetical protein